MKRLPWRTEAHLEMKRDMRRLYDRSPKAFTSVMNELMAAGEQWLKHLPPMETGAGTKPIEVDKNALALLLADYRNRPKGWTKERFLERLASEGASFGTAYVRGRWENADTIAHHLKKAMRLAKQEEAFADKVQFYQEAFADLRIGSIAWD